jgi:hypothetical protein
MMSQSPDCGQLLQLRLSNPTALGRGRYVLAAGTDQAKEGSKEWVWRLYQEAQQKFFQPTIKSGTGESEFARRVDPVGRCGYGEEN